MPLGCLCVDRGSYSVSRSIRDSPGCGAPLRHGTGHEALNMEPEVWPWSARTWYSSEMGIGAEPRQVSVRNVTVATEHDAEGRLRFVFLFRQPHGPGPHTRSCGWRCYAGRLLAVVVHVLVVFMDTLVVAAQCFIGVWVRVRVRVRVAVRVSDNQGESKG